MNAPKLERYIKDRTGTKVEMSRRSVNITAKQNEFIESNNLNLSLLTRDVIDSMMGHKLNTRIDESKITFELLCHPEEIEIEGNVLASGDPVEDQIAEESVRRDLESGNEWAWCTIEVRASIDGLEIKGHDYLGGCSYKGRDEFESSDEFENMKQTAKLELIQQLEKFERVLSQVRL